MKIGVTIGKVNHAAEALVELQEATALLVLMVDLAVVVDFETQTNIEKMEIEQETKAAPMSTWVMSITLFSI